MPSTPYKGYSIPTTGTEAGTWGNDLNTNSFTVIDNNLGGLVTKTLSNANVTLTATESQSLILKLSGTLSAAVQVTTSCQGLTIVDTTSLASPSYAVTITNGIGTPVALPFGRRTIVVFDVTNGGRIASSSRLDDVATSGALFRATPSSGWATDLQRIAVVIAKDNAGAVIQSGIQGDIFFPYPASIREITLLCDQVGSISFDLWKAQYSAFPPTAANTIFTGGYPTIVGGIKYDDSALTMFNTTAINQNDVIRVYVGPDVSAVTRYTLTLTISRY